ncbi:MAG: hypothetical protein V1872_07450 [bacterium]
MITLITSCFPPLQPKFIITHSEGGVRLIIEELEDGTIPDWSPGGQQIVYVSNGIYTMNVLGKKETKKISSEGKKPAWSPDSNFIAYANNKGIWIKSLKEDSEAINLVTKGYHPRWSPDGKYIAYASEGIHINNLTTKEDFSLTNQGINPEWSPDGKYLLYSELSSDKINFNIYIINLENNYNGLLLERASYAAFSPDQRYIIFVREGIYLKSIKDGKVKRITWSGYMPRWSPDGKKIICYLDDKIWLLDSPYTINNTPSPLDFSSLNLRKVLNIKETPKIVKVIAEPTEISADKGGEVKIIATVTDPNGLDDIESVALYHGETKYQELVIGSKDEGTGVVNSETTEETTDKATFFLNLLFYPGITPSDFNFDVVAIDKNGNMSERVPVGFKILPSMRIK